MHTPTALVIRPLLLNDPKLLSTPSYLLEHLSMMQRMFCCPLVTHYKQLYAIHLLILLCSRNCQAMRLFPTCMLLGHQCN